MPPAIPALLSSGSSPFQRFLPCTFQHLLSSKMCQPPKSAFFPFISEALFGNSQLFSTRGTCSWCRCFLHSAPAPDSSSARKYKERKSKKKKQPGKGKKEQLFCEQNSVKLNLILQQNARIQQPPHSGGERAQNTEFHPEFQLEFHPESELPEATPQHPADPWG